MRKGCHSFHPPTGHAILHWPVSFLARVYPKTSMYRIVLGQPIPYPCNYNYAWLSSRPHRNNSYGIAPLPTWFSCLLPFPKATDRTSAPVPLRSFRNGCNYSRKECFCLLHQSWSAAHAHGCVPCRYSGQRHNRTFRTPSSRYIPRQEKATVHRKGFLPDRGSE